MAAATITDLFNKVVADKQAVGADQQKLTADQTAEATDSKALYTAVLQYGKPVIVPDPKATTPLDVLILTAGDSGTVTFTQAVLGEALIPTPIPPAETTPAAPAPT